MIKEGKYIYCIVGTEQERSFGAIGINDSEVITVGYNDLCMLISNHPLTKFVINPENILAHERVIEGMMKEFDSVLPIRFGTIASDADEIRNLLDRRYREFKILLRNMDHKVELSVKVIWQDMDIIFKEILKENKDIRQEKKKIQKNNENINITLEVGQMVEHALTKKKEEEQERIIDLLRRTAFDYKLNKPIGDEMVMNAAFLVDKGREKEFDNIMDDLSDKYRDRMRFVYTGPLPVFNFVNITIYPEEWEK
ncbi:GvpL/GvpF family gas vesicle protein [bacterium]|nr:GvpL/GvpF family gas vesicle protein [bacterium]MBU1753279.1 GvpL/GvpF family gas vesicle protein [bacterium]